ncbi:MAG: hypothetical protein H6600_02270 [Flavobacteriales bacterium]|nr:hypothetical protein [Flavobacteriales bacterium]MCB9197256.1 hypothetical protein [Flavobacteriales bacterium]
MRFTLPLLILSFILFSACKGEDHDISLKLEKGETYAYYVKGEVNIEQEITGMQMKQYVEVSSKILYTVIDIVDDNYKFEVRYESIKMYMDMGMGAPISVDSDNPNPMDPTGKILEKLKDEIFYVTVSKYGEIIQFEGLDEMADNVIESMGITDYAAEAQVRGFLEQSYSEKSLIAAFEPMFNIYPTTSVSEGDTWEKENKGENIIGKAKDYFFTLSLAKTGSYHISGNGKMVESENSEPVNIGGNEIIYHLNGEGTSSFEVDAETGWVIKGQTENTAEGVNQITVLQLGQTMDVPMKYHAVISFSKDKFEE